MVAVLKHEVELSLSFEDLQQVHQVAVFELLQEEGEGRGGEGRGEGEVRGRGREGSGEKDRGREGRGGEEVERGEVSVMLLDNLCQLPRQVQNAGGNQRVWEQLQ